MKSDESERASQQCFVNGCTETFDTIEDVEDHIIEEAEKAHEIREETLHHIVRCFLPERAGT